MALQLPQRVGRNREARRAHRRIGELEPQTAPERRGVLVLLPSEDAGVGGLELEGALGELRRQRPLLAQGGERGHQRHPHRARAAQPEPGGASLLVKTSKPPAGP